MTGQRAGLLGGVGILVVVVGYSLWWWSDHTAASGRPPAKRLALIHLKNEALAHLENLVHAEAESRFRQIVQSVPDDPLGHRNLAIALFAPADEGHSLRIDAKNAAANEPLIAAVERLLRVDGGAAESHIVAGRAFQELAEAARNRRDDAAFDRLGGRAREHFRQAAKLAPQYPAPLFFLFEMQKSQDDPLHISESSLELLQTVVRRAPDNFALLLEFLEHLTERRSAASRSTLEKVLRLIPESLDGVRKEENPAWLLQDAKELLDKSPDQIPAAVATRVQQAHNFFKRHPAYRQAMSRLKPHLLEFVALDFQSAFYEGLPPERVEPEIPVRFVLFPPDGAGEASDMLRVFYEDLNGDRTFRTVIARSSNGTVQVEVAGQGADIPPVIAVPGRFASFQLADLDLDIRAGPDGNGNLPADFDLILIGADSVRLLENGLEAGKRQWVDRTAAAGLPPLAGVKWLLCSDMDHDGNMDLVMGLEKGIRILRNRGDWTFHEVSNRSPGLADLETIAGTAADFDRDGDLDFYSLAGTGGLIFLENQRSGRFVPRTIADLRHESASHIVSFDANNDGVFDLLIGAKERLHLLLGERDRLFSCRSPRIDVPVGATIHELGLLDYDNDGWLDLWVVVDNPQRPLRLLRNVQGREFGDRTSSLPASTGGVQSVVAGDVDGDGDIDLLFVGQSKLQGLRNEGGNKNHWLDVRLRALMIKDEIGMGQAAKCNYFNIGGTVELKAGRHYQKQQVSGSVVHFGLGPRKQVDSARMIWTNGVPQAVVRPSPDQIAAVEQAPKGSCPPLFTWNGERFVFVTDCLWSSALGMKLAEGVFMDHQRQHNYLVVSDRELRPREGKYVLQFTNELWEVPYLDQVQLWVVDHPAEVEVYTNQRIPPSATEPFRLLTVRQRRSPVAAKDHHGRDVLPVIRRRDGDYLGGFQRQRYIGLAEPHWLELDLGDLRAAKQATLFLTGWIWPTDTTANVAISQDPRFSGSPGVVGGVRPPALQVPNGRGGWTTALPMMGFPSGKMQTVAVELPLSQFPAGDYRVRIATSMELYWDEAFFTIDEPAAELRIQKLAVAAADLHDRGFSRIYQNAPTSPFLFDYDDFDPSPRWLPMRGPYTRYGPTTNLLHAPDSQYVVMSPGDELTLAFNALPPPPAGIRRTYLFYANGWLKDFDMNGGASNGVEPLPFEGMTRYPYAEAEEFPRTPEMTRFRQNTLTREVDAEFFWSNLRRKPVK